MNSVKYSAIFDWSMTSDEAEVYKLALSYEEEFVKFFADTPQFGRVYKRNTIPRSGDPRKSNIFRYCWRLKRETRGLLKPEEYGLYIRANMCILKLNNARVEPNSICGEKAWIRWKVWYRWYKNKLHDLNSQSPSVGVANPKVVGEIDKTKRFLFEKCEGVPSQEKILGFFESGILKFWVMTGKVSKYYVVTSPYLKDKVTELSESCSFDPTLTRERITPDVSAYFREEFSHEFRN